MNPLTEKKNVKETENTRVQMEDSVSSSLFMNNLQHCLRLLKRLERYLFCILNGYIDPNDHKWAAPG